MFFDIFFSKKLKKFIVFRTWWLSWIYRVEAVDIPKLQRFSVEIQPIFSW